MMLRFAKNKSASLLALFLFFSVFLTGRIGADSGVAFERGELAFVTPAGQQIEFEVEWALSSEQRAHGLMQRRMLAKNSGMLFDFGMTRSVSMWMANTPLSLDMIFIDEAGKVIKIAAKTTPFSKATIESGGPVRYVLEIQGGQAAERGVTVGSRLILPLNLPLEAQP